MIIVISPFDEAFVGFTVVSKYSVVVSSLTVVLLPMVSTEIFETSVDVTNLCSVGKLFGDSVVIFKDPVKLYVDFILLEVDGPSENETISCSVDKLFGYSVVLFKDPGKLSVVIILLEVDEPFVNGVVTFCSRDKVELSTVVVIILLDVAELSGMVVTLCNGVDFSVDVNLPTSEFSFDVVGNSISVVSGVRVVVAITGALIL